MALSQFFESSRTGWQFRKSQFASNRQTNDPKMAKILALNFSTTTRAILTLGGPGQKEAEPFMTLPLVMFISFHNGRRIPRPHTRLQDAGKLVPAHQSFVAAEEGTASESAALVDDEPPVQSTAVFPGPKLVNKRECAGSNILSEPEKNG